VVRGWRTTKSLKSAAGQITQCHLTQDEKELDKRRWFGPSLSHVGLQKVKAKRKAIGNADDAE
jgi:hypothetical protein